MKHIASDGSVWHIENVSPPIPTRVFDWEWVSEDYDGPGDDRHGNAASLNGAIDAIEDWIEETEADAFEEDMGYFGYAGVMED